MTVYAWLFGLGAGEIILLVVLGVLLFGKSLPSMGRYIGKSIVEFKKGVKGLEDDLEGGAAPRHEGGVVPDQQLRAPQRVAVTAPKFEDAAPAPTTTSVTSAPPKV